MGVSGVIAAIGGILSAGATTAGVIEASNQAGDAKKAAAENKASQDQLYKTLQDQEAQQGAGAANQAKSQAVEAETNNIKRNAGAASTILTSPLGVPNTDNSSLGKRTLLGV